MNKNDPLSLRNISIWALFCVLGGALVDWSLRNADVYNLGVGTIVTFAVFAFVLGTSGPLPLWILIYNKIQDKERIEATVVIFTINTTFPEWVRVFDDHLEKQKSAGIETLFRGVSKENPKKVLAILQAKSGVIERFLKINSTNWANSEQILNSENSSIYLPNG